jgi:hypothetical protein
VICEIIVHLLIIVQNNKNEGRIFLRNASVTHQITRSYTAFITLNLTLASFAPRSIEQVRSMASKQGGSCYAETRREQSLWPVRNKNRSAAARSAALPNNRSLSSMFRTVYLSIHRFSMPSPHPSFRYTKLSERNFQFTYFRK